MTVFSWRVKGCLSKPMPSMALVQRRTRKKARRLAETLSEGMMPVLRLSFMTMTLNRMERRNPTTKARTVSCSRHDGKGFSRNACSTDASSPAALSSPAPRAPVRRRRRFPDSKASASSTEAIWSIYLFGDFVDALRLPLGGRDIYGSQLARVRHDTIRFGIVADSASEAALSWSPPIGIARSDARCLGEGRPFSIPRRINWRCTAQSSN
jgi:hypothetical protein